MNGLDLVIVGKPGLPFAGHSRITALPDNVKHLTEVADETLACLYTGAQGLLYPSLYEGFGLPMLEAMACGCPSAVTSNCTSMPEVAGDAAVLVDPTSEDSIAEGILRLAAGKDTEGLRAKGFERHRLYSWDRTTRIVENVLLS